MLNETFSVIFKHRVKIFILGPESPVGLRGHQMVASYDKTMLYTIGNDLTTHKLSCVDIKKCQWTEMVTKLKKRRHGAVAFQISNELTKKIC